MLSVSCVLLDISQMSSSFVCNQVLLGGSWSVRDFMLQTETQVSLCRGRVWHRLGSSQRASELGAYLRHDGARQTAVRHRRLLGESDDTRTSVHQFRSNSADRARG